MSILLPLLLSAVLAAPPPKVQILGPGVYYRSEVPKSLDGRWLSLCEGEEGWALKATALVARPVSMQSDRKGGVRISPKDQVESLLLLKGLPKGVREGAIASADNLATEGDTPQIQRTRGVFQGESFEVWSEDLGGKDYVLRFRVGNRTQVLLVEQQCADCSWDLLWAGDLDGDERPDLLVATSGLENQGSLRLFLSSYAQEHQNVGAAGSHRWTFGD